MRARSSAILRAAVASLWVLLLTAPSYGQVTLAPTFVYVDGPERYATALIKNRTAAVQEIIIDFEFGYPAADSLGRRYFEYDDAKAEAKYSLSSWIRAFPQRFRIEPKHRQLVRLMLNPPSDLPVGVYWTRMVVTSREQVVQRRENDGARVNFEFKQVIPVVYSHGTSATDVAVSRIEVVPDPGRVTLMVVLDRRGAVPFFGTIDLRLLDRTGIPVAEVQTTTDAYFKSSTYFTLDRDIVPTGRYIAEISLRAERSDVPGGSLPAMEPVTRRFSIFIPDVAVIAASAQ